MGQGDALLSLDEAVLLGHALASAAADAAGVRHLLIKGPSLERYGLRESRGSSDVDVLVDPSGTDAVVAKLAEYGWYQRPLPAIASMLPSHSITLIHDSWPCDMDVHWRFPGFLAEDSVVFDALWTRRKLMDFAGVACPVPDRTGSVLLLALHSLRSSERLERHPAELSYLVSRAELKTPEVAAALTELARITGCEETLAGALEPLGLRSPSVGDERPGLAEWNLRIANGASGAQLWLNVLREMPWYRRIFAIPRILWPSEHDFRLAKPEIADSRSALNVARRTRLLNSLRELPRVVATRRSLIRASRLRARAARAESKSGAASR